MHIIKVVAATIMGQDWRGRSRHDPWGKGRGRERIWLDQMQLLVFLFMKHWSPLVYFTNIPSLEQCCTLAWSCEHMILPSFFLVFVFQCSISVQTVAACSLSGDASGVYRTVQNLAGWEPDGWGLQAPPEYQWSYPSFIVRVPFLLDSVSETAKIKASFKSLCKEKAESVTVQKS